MIKFLVTLFPVLYTATIAVPFTAADKTMKCKDCRTLFICTDAKQ